MPNIQLADNLRHLRKKRSLTQNHLSEMLNISRQAYSNYETSKRTPDLDSLLTLAKFYNVSLDNLVLGNLRDFDTLSTELITESPVPYTYCIDEKTGNTIYLSEEETELMLSYRTLPGDTKQLITGFVLRNKSAD